MSLRQQKWTWPECQPHFCMAEQDEAAAEALRGMNEAPDPPRAPGNQFQHNMGQSDAGLNNTGETALYCVLYVLYYIVYYIVYYLPAE